MPKNKSALSRYRIIDELIRTGRYKRKELIHAVNRRLEQKGLETISPATLSNDLQAMRTEFHAPIECEPGKGYRYLDKSYRFLQVRLNSEESSALDFAIDILGSKDHLDLIHEARQVISQVALSTKSPDTPLIVRSGVSLNVKGVEYLKTLYSAIRNKNCLNVTYQSRTHHQPKVHVFSPYLLREYRGLWYVIGRSSLHDRNLLVLALDRIHRIDANIGVSYQEEDPRRIQDFFQFSFGITVKETPTTIRFRVTPDAWYFLNIQPLHPSQHVVEKHEEWVTVEISVYWCEELKMTLLSQGARLQVVSPPEIVTEMREQVDKMRSLYPG